MKGLILCLVAILVVHAEKECAKKGIAKWRWPKDFKLLSSKDPLWEYYNYNCWIFRDKTTLQNGKYFCWKKKETTPPITFRGIWEDDHGESCSAMLEPADVLYKVQTFCTSYPTAHKFKMNWHFNNPFGFDSIKCIRFNRWNLGTDIWVFNYMCGEKIVFEKEYCIEE